MYRTKIEWCDWTWNPVTGCLGPDGNGPCEYCYAREIAHRFCKPVARRTENGQPFYCGSRTHAFPVGFDPTFYPYRLDDPAKVEKPGTVFVCSMGDLFGEWVPEHWVKQVFGAMEAAPWHSYVVLTKNPVRAVQMRVEGKLIHNVSTLLGTSIGSLDFKTYGQIEFGRLVDLLCLGRLSSTVLSIEPMMGPFPAEALPPHLSWLIIGGLTGRKTFAPPVEWIRPLVEWGREHGVPVFVKDNCHYPEVVREWPVGMRGCFEDSTGARFRAALGEEGAN